ncbi:MAG: HD-GYP domain-containing protein [Treponema sp.]|nr:HD-GYP domain-containing protein [Treponema sp.]
MNSYPVEGIPPSSYFSRAVYLDPHFVIAAPEMPFTASLAKILCEWDFNEVFSDGEPRDNYVPNDVYISQGSSIGDRSTIGDLDKLQQAERFYARFQRYTESLFDKAERDEGLSLNSIAENIKNACDFVREYHRYLMRAQRHIEPVRDEDYLVSHTVRSTIITIIIGIYLKLPTHRLIELGTAALLHDIGMIKLPEESYLNSKSLSEHEKKQIYAHPVLAYNILKAHDFPLTVSVAVLEHHERENGTGYPQQLRGEKISLYAKIIGVACSYEAISAKRLHREARSGHSGMLELLKNEGKKYDDTIVRALVYSLSIYPIGLYVMLSSGRKGQVVDVNPENPRFPIVQVFGELMPDGKNRIMQTAPDGLSIVRPLNREEIED